MTEAEPPAPVDQAEVVDQAEIDRQPQSDRPGAPNDRPDPFVASFGQAIIALNLQHQITAWSDGAEHLFGYTPQEAIGSSVIDLLWPAGAGSQARELLDEMARKKAPLHYQSQRRRKDGTLVEVAVTALGVHNAAGQLTGVSVIYRDISGRDISQLENSSPSGLQAEREAQAYTRGLIESCLDAMLMVGGDLIIIDVNEQAGNLIGAPREMLIGSRFDGYFIDPARAALGIRRTLTEGCISDYELSLKPENGRQIVISINASVFRKDAGQSEAAFAVARDVTRQRELEWQLRQAQAYTRGLIESSMDAMIAVNRDLIITDVNERMAELTEVPRPTLIGSRFERWFTEPQRAAAGVKETLANGFVTNYELAIHTSGGREIPVSFNASTFYGAGGNSEGVLVVARDVTQRKRFEAELTAARDEALEGARMKSEFLANMSHEIRTPLNSMIGLGNMLLETDLSGAQRGLVREIQDNNEGLLAIINDVLDFSKMSVGKLLFEVVDFELEKVIESTLKLLAASARNKGLEVAMTIEPGTPEILSGDPGRLRQVLANLLSNAVKFTQHGEIVLRAGQIGEQVGEKVGESGLQTTLRFEVCDTGVGIPEEEQEQIFRSFTQAGKRPQEGTGLGLAIARTLAEQMGGNIGVLSAPGNGSTFWFTARFAQPRNPPGSRTATRVLEGLSALIVDDNETIRSILKAQLKSWQAAVVDTAAGAEEALAMLRAPEQAAQPYSIAMIDEKMPRIGGIELARMIRAMPHAANLRLVLLSSNPDALDETGTAALNLTARLEKPLRTSELYDVLSGAFRLHPAPGQCTTADAETADSVTVTTGAAAASGVPQEMALQLPGKPRVLLIEDNAGSRKVALWQLEKLGCTADSAVSGAQGLAMLARTSYDLVLMDCRMPGMDGYETTRRIRQSEDPGRRTRIVAMTAHALEQDQKKCLDAGMDDYLSKPVTLESMATIIRRVLAIRPVAGGDSQIAPRPVLDSATLDPVILDPKTMASLRAKRDLLPGLIDTVMDEIPEQLKQIADALAMQACSDAAVGAHSLKGTAKIFGAARMAELAGGLEQTADAEDAASAAAQLDGLRQECERVLRELEKERVQPAPE